jgi:MerR family copper efflux transcriptional regulator
LLRPPRRSEAGYRLYDDTDLRLMTLISRGMPLGFTLADIGVLVGGDGPRWAVGVWSAALAMAADIAVRQREVAAVRDRLRRLAEVCADDADADCMMLRVGR